MRACESHTMSGEIPVSQDMNVVVRENMVKKLHLGRLQLYENIIECKKHNDALHVSYRKFAEEFVPCREWFQDALNDSNLTVAQLAMAKAAHENAIKDMQNAIDCLRTAASHMEALKGLYANTQP